MIPDRKVPNVFKDVRAFIQLAQPDMMTPLTELPLKNMLVLLDKLVNEEVNIEFFPNLRAMINGGVSLERMVQCADDAMDSMWVLIWGLEAMGIPTEACWNELTRANMSKFPLIDEINLPFGPTPLDIPEYKNSDGNFISHDVNTFAGRWILTNRATGKVMKPAGFKPPNMHAVIEGMINIQKLRTMPDVISTTLHRDYFHVMEERIEKGEISG